MTRRARRLPLLAGVAPQSVQPWQDPAMASALGIWMAAVMRLHTVDPITTELVRLRCAHHHDCRMCQSLRLASALDAGFDETMTAKVERYEESDLEPKHKAALRLADAMMAMPKEAERLRDELRRYFSDAQILEITLAVMKWNHQKIKVSLGIDDPVDANRLVPFSVDDEGIITLL